MTPLQEKIKELSNMPVTKIAEKLGITEKVVKAQMTRMHLEPPRPKPSRPSASTVSDNTRILDEITDTATGKISKEAVQKFVEQINTNETVHPMVMLGVTMQYMKLCGGRLAAHKTIEEVYHALKTMVE